MRNVNKSFAFAAGRACALAWFVFGLWSGASAQGVFPDAQCQLPPSECGQVSPFIPMQGAPREIGSVVLLRSDHNTHSLTTGDRYVKLAFRAKENDGELRVRAPKLPGQAVPGIYMLFVVDANGVPSVGRRIDLKPDEEQLSSNSKLT